jgi:HAE1 family hydrophobic/amphiphilic exporter-1
MQWLAELCVRRPVFATVLSIVILVVGSVFYVQLGVDQFPKVEFPFVTVTTILPGASPADVEREVSDKVEAAVNTISGVEELRSSSSEGLSMVMIQFVLEKSADVAAQEVQQKINMVLGELPKGIEPPVVTKVDPDSAPVLFIALNGKDRTPREITDLADRVVRRRLESVSGVGQVTVIGGRKRQVHVLVDPVRLRSLGISPAEVAGAINAQNMTLPGGRLDQSRDYVTLQVAGRVRSIEALKDIVVREQSGRAVRLEELATVEDGVEDLQSSARWNGEPTVLLALRKQSGTNTLSVVDAVYERLALIRADLPRGFSIDIQRDGSQVVRTGTNAVKEHLVLGALFAAIIVLVFLGNLRSTIIAALAIPTSIIGTFALMKLQGYTLNTITLLALALAVGIVIDDAIVVLENIFKFVEEKGMDPMTAAVEGTREIGPAVLATTLSLIAVFLPIAFISGIAGRFLGSFGMTMSFSIAVSLFISFTLTPMLASRWLKRHDANAPKPVLTRLVDTFYRPIESAYVSLLTFCMRHRWVVVVASLASIGSCVPLTMKARKGFLPIDDRAQFEVVVRLPEGSSVPATELTGERVARQIREFPEVSATLVTVGDDGARSPNVARIFVKMTPPEARTVTQNLFKDVIRSKVVPALPKDLRVNIADVNEFGGGQSTARMQYSLSGPDLQTLEAATPSILERMRRIPEIVDLDSSLVVGKPQLDVEIDRDRAADLGVQVADVAMALQYQVAGLKVSTFEENGEQYDVRIRALDNYRTSEDALRLLTVNSRKLGLVSLADVVKTKRSSGATTISRYQRERQVMFMANGAAGADESRIGEAMLAAIRDENLPSTFTSKVQGQSKMMRDTGKSFALGLLASLVFMYLILAAQFESWLHPLTILVSLPLTLPFAVLSVILFDQALDLYSFLGIFVLFGVVKKNAILQVDHTNVLRARGLNRFDAILQANRDRLRPILMTTLAFVAGMIPLVTAKGIGAGFNRATAGVVVGGQSLSLILTLVAVPVVYSFFDDLAQFVRRLGAPNESLAPAPLADALAPNRSMESGR